jgi:phosphate transport system permease protein
LIEDISEHENSVADLQSAVTAVQPRPKVSRRREDSIYHAVTLVVALSLVLLLIAVVALLLSTAWPAFAQQGFGFLIRTKWDEYANLFGAAPFIAGTLLTTALALLFAVPLSLAIAVLLNEYTPRSLAGVLGVIIEVAAGVPTIVFGVWGMLVLVPWMHDAALPALAAVFGWLPILDPGRYPQDLNGYGMLTTSLILAAMIFPTIASVSRNAILAAPHEMREASLGLGATRWETATRVILRQARPGIIGSIVLACGRALGETIAIVNIVGAVTQLPHSLYSQGSTLAVQLKTQILGAFPGSQNMAALYELGLILLLFSMATSIIGRMLTRRLASTARLSGGI